MGVGADVCHGGDGMKRERFKRGWSKYGLFRGEPVVTEWLGRAGRKLVGAS